MRVTPLSQLRLRFLLAPLWLLLALAVVGPAGCGSDGKGTTLVVSVASDLSIGTEVDAVEIVVADGELSYPFALGSGAGKSTLPIRIALVPGGQSNRQFRVEARGRLGADTVVTQSATVSFVPGSAQQLVLFLARSCVKFPQCSPGHTCQNGACVAEATAGGRGIYGDDAGFSDADSGSDTPIIVTGSGGAGAGGQGGTIDAGGSGGHIDAGGFGGTTGSGTGGAGAGTGGAGAGTGGGTGGMIGGIGGMGVGGSGTGGRMGTGGTIGTGGSVGTGGNFGTGGAGVGGFSGTGGIGGLGGITGGGSGGFMVVPLDGGTGFAGMSGGT
jgi:hypothetical protein